VKIPSGENSSNRSDEAAIVGIGANQYETQTNYFLAHWLPNLQGATMEKRKKFFLGENLPAARFIFIDPRRTNTIAVAEQVAKDRVLHLDIEPGTDIALFNGLLTHVVENGWIDKDFIAKHTTGYDEAVRRGAQSRTASFPPRSPTR
jgi:arsenite oxidase large subunit